jgi:hypothetical protein
MCEMIVRLLVRVHKNVSIRVCSLLLKRRAYWLNLKHATLV